MTVSEIVTLTETVALTLTVTGTVTMKLNVGIDSESDRNCTVKLKILSGFLSDISHVLKDSDLYERWTFSSRNDLGRLWIVIA